MPEKNNLYSFQLTVDSDSIFISQAPGSKKSRATITEINHNGLEQIAKSIIDADLGEKLIELLADHLYTEPVTRNMFILYVGFDEKPDASTKEEIRNIVRAYSESFTLLDADGYYKDQKEHTLLVHLGVQNHQIAYQCAEELRKTFNQDGVGVIESSEYKRVVKKGGA